MNVRILLAVVPLLSAAPALAANWTTESFRTSRGSLVQIGDSMVEVLQNAGQPVEQRVVSKGITIGEAVGLTREQWTYRGSDAIYVVTFAGNEVTRIEVVPYR